MVRTWKVVAVVAALSLSLSLSGCSFFMATNPSGWKPSQKPTCSDSSAAPAVDTVMAVVGAVGVAWGVQCYSETSGELIGICRMGMTMSVLTALLWGGGAVVGSLRVRACSKAKRQHEEWLPRHPEVSMAKQAGNEDRRKERVDRRKPLIDTR